MSDVILANLESVTTVTVVDDVVELAISNAGVQGATGYYAQGDPIYVIVRNATGATLAKGSIVYVSGANGTHTQVTKAIASGEATSARTLGWVAADIANNADGYVQVEGYLEGINTQGVAEGAQLYLSPTTAGAFTVTKPIAPNHIVYVGVCAKASAGNGKVYVKVQNGAEITELADVLIVSPANNNVLQYDSASQLWKNVAASTLSVGTAVYSVNSGTAVFATNSGTAVYATTSGTATTISGTITKSQVSDFTSGTVTSASTAQQAGTAVYSVNTGTAVYATTSGTAVTISGSITKSQVSDFTSGTVTSASTAQQAGTAVFATTSGTATYSDTSGTAVYATTSGTAVYATNSGTAVFATNASTAVTISGSITQSQVTDLVSDLAGKANLAGGNAFTGAQTVTGTATGSIVQILRGASGQANDYFSIQNSGGTALARANLNGSFFFGQTTGSYPTFFGAAGSLAGMINVVPASAAVIPIIIRGATGQTANLQEWQESNSGVPSSVNSTGQLRVRTFANSMGFTALGVAAAAATEIPVAVRGAASQTANLQEWQNSAGTVLSSFDANGNGNFLRANLRGATYATGIYFGALNVQQEPSGNGIVVQGQASQTSDLVRIQNGSSSTGDLMSFRNSGGTVLARIFADGSASFSSGNAAISAGGAIRGVEVSTASDLATMRQANSGGFLRMTRQTAALSNQGANIGALYFRDGTTTGTLKLVVRAGAAGAETTILDNIPQ